MRSFFIIAFHTIKQVIKQKSFIITSITMAILVVISCMLLGRLPVDLLNYGLEEVLFNDNGLLALTSNHLVELHGENLDAELKQDLPKVLFHDSDRLLGEHIYMLYDFNYNFVIDSTMLIDNIMNKVYEGYLYSAVIIRATETGGIYFEYIIPQELRFNREDAALISSVLETIHTTAILSAQRISESDIQLITSGVSYTLKELEGASPFNTAVIIPIAVAFLLYHTIVFYSYMVAVSITKEKTSRVIETLIISTNSSAIVIGKTIGMSIVGMLQLLFLGIIFFLSFQSFVTTNISFIHDMLDNLYFNFFNITILFIYLLLGYLLYSFLSAIAGAASSKPEDVQLAVLPISLTLVVTILASIVGIVFPSNRVGEITALLPITSPFSMPGRALLGYASNAEIIVSITVLLLTVLFVTFIAIRIYSVAILHYGNRLRLKDLFNIALKIK